MTDAVKEKFIDASEGEHGWQIRYGAEPIDFHLFKNLEEKILINPSRQKA